MNEVWIVIEGLWDDRVVSVHSSEEKANKAKEEHYKHGAKDNLVIVSKYVIDAPCKCEEDEED